jgi:hypothetical protein
MKDITGMLKTSMNKETEVIYKESKREHGTVW